MTPQELADALFADAGGLDGLVLAQQEELRALAEAAYRLGQHDGWSVGYGDARFRPIDYRGTNPYGGDDEPTA